MTKKGIVILWLTGEGVGEWENFEGSDIEGAIAYTKSDGRYCNYGRWGAVVAKVTPVYSVERGMVEKVLV